MKTTRNATTTRPPVSLLKMGGTRIEASKLKVTVHVGGLHGSELQSAVQGLDEAELLAFMSDAGASRAARIAGVLSLEDVGLLVALAASDCPRFIARDALLRIEELLDGSPLHPAFIDRLLPCLGDPDLLAYTVSLLDESGFNWCASCGVETAHALCVAMSGCCSIDESVLLEDAYAQLAHNRPDLSADLQACTPASFLPHSVYASFITDGAPLFIENVA